MGRAPRTGESSHFFVYENTEDTLKKVLWFWLTAELFSILI